MDEDKALQLLEEKLDESIRLHQVSDVPVGLFLSGGLDSSAIAYFMHRQNQDVQAFAMGFESENKWYNELPYAEAVAGLYCKSFEFEIVKPRIWDLLPRLMWFYDEPFGDGSMLPSYLVSAMAKKHVKAVLGGDGGDEIFAGYNRYFEDYPEPVPPNRSFFQKILGRGKKSAYKFTKQYLRTMTPFFESRDLIKILNPDFKNDVRQYQEWFLDKHFSCQIETPKDRQILDIQTILPEQYLTKVDRASMANSLELRVPMLDIPLVEYMLSLSCSVYLKKRTHKYLFKKLMKNRLPETIITRKKRGFSIPLKELWDVKMMHDYVLNGKAVRDGFLQKNYIKNLGYNVTHETTHKLWQLSIFETWYQVWL
ncbi:MAG: hypothetical protein C4541_00815 [Candidatus Auribacter fodinae]|uniref:asparagine synthase (glutamine-hydrolyzing) n=1 Tax=Candidatus Auribacter fodinae TaxID=2093366 RepID=A0A3A4RAD8_9BACT|nr:MAG: hypothetical protein C4541_00815 [Candidatus Auribacter fodinae]